MWELVINADDLGAMEKVNVAIDNHMANGTISSATLIANGKAIEQSMQVVDKHKQCSFGVHLNLSEGIPIGNKNGLSGLLDQNGCFKPNFRNIALNKEIKQGIANEWLAQIAKIKAMGVDVSHIDSHHHVHTRPSLLSVIKYVAKESGISKWRRSKTLYTLNEHAAIKIFFKKKYNFLLGAGYAKTTGLTDFTDAAAMLEYVNEINGGRAEVMCHPGLSTSEPEDKMLVKLANHPKVVLKNYWQI